MQSVRALAALQDHGEGSRSELDSHADTCVTGRDSLVIHDFDRPVNITGYDPNQLVAKAFRTVGAALAYDDPVNGEVIILVVHQAIHIPHLSHNLLSPFQMRLNDVTVNDTPRLLTNNPTETTHTLSVPGGFGTGDEFVIPLDLFGVSSGFLTRKPTEKEYESCDRRYELTYESPEYDPSDPTFAKQEEAMTDLSGVAHETDGDSASRVRILCKMSRTNARKMSFEKPLDSAETMLYEVSNALSDRTFLTAMVANVRVSGVKSSDRRQGIVGSKLGNRIARGGKDVEDNDSTRDPYVGAPVFVPSFPDSGSTAAIQATTDRVFHRHVDCEDRVA